MLTQSWPMVKDRGRVGGSRLVTKRSVGRKTASQNHVATSKFRIALLNYTIREIGSKWFVVTQNGEYISRHDSSGEAVAALSALAR